METATIINAFKTILDAIIEAPVATVSAIAAIISAIGAIYSIRVTKKENEKNIESTEKILIRFKRRRTKEIKHK